MHGLQNPMDGLIAGGALIHTGFPLLPWTAMGAHEQGVEAVRDAVLVVVEATAAVGGDVLGFVLAIPAVVFINRALVFDLMVYFVMRLNVLLLLSRHLATHIELASLYYPD